MAGVKRKLDPDGSATAYLQRHKIPALIDTALAQLLQERPENARAFLARRLLGPERPVAKQVPTDAPPVGFVIRVTDADAPEGAHQSVAGSDESYFVPAADSFQAGRHECFSLYQAHNTKTVWFLRHAQAEHNPRLAQAGDDDAAREAVRQDMSLWDAHLTPAGRAQAARLADTLENVHGPAGFRPQLVVTSPLARSIETAVGVLGGDVEDGSRRLNAMSDADPRWGVSESGSAPVRWLATELCRERVANCYNGRRNVSELRQKYPFIDFSLMPHDKDELWEHHREPADGPEVDTLVGERAEAFMKWLLTRPEQRVVVVTNATFMRALFIRFGFSLSDMESKKFAAMPHNCEMRRVVVCPHQNPRSMKIAKRFRLWIQLPDSRFEE
eukprot:TRINITY_DN61640_c0_g1_i1.p1 TRINITY_DN61640_c0_g1~~TRINITY_DN61640_c0_g1_i1.p1  ORF type:complete len:386 (+),score=84.76 TRINITY_DN61640_c0_g1_i1:140-1297(+)